MSDPTFLSDPPESSEATVFYDEDLASDGYVNNLTRVWCWRPDVLEEFVGTRGQLVGGSSLSQRELAVMVVAAAAARGDAYCALAWGRRLADLADVGSAVRLLEGKPPEGSAFSPRERALAGWARQVVLDPNATTGADVDRLREAGLDDREIFEATAWVAFRLAFSTVNDALGALPDRGLAAAVPAEVRDAITYGRRAPRAVAD